MDTYPPQNGIAIGIATHGHVIALLMILCHPPQDFVRKAGGRHSDSAGYGRNQGFGRRRFISPPESKPGQVKVRTLENPSQNQLRSSWLIGVGATFGYGSNQRAGVLVFGFIHQCHFGNMFWSHSWAFLKKKQSIGPQQMGWCLSSVTLEIGCPFLSCSKVILNAYLGLRKNSPL